MGFDLRLRRVNFCFLVFVAGVGLGHLGVLNGACYQKKRVYVQSLYLVSQIHLSWCLTIWYDAVQRFTKARFRVHSLLDFVLLMVRCVEFGAGMSWVSVVFCPAQLQSLSSLLSTLTSSIMTQFSRYGLLCSSTSIRTLAVVIVRINESTTAALLN